MPDEKPVTPASGPDLATGSGSVGAVASQSPVEAAAAPQAPEPIAPVVAPDEPAKVPEAAPEAKPETPPPSLLAEPEVKPAPSDVKAPDATADGPAPVEPPLEALAPTFQPFKLPEGVSFEQERMGQFTDTLGSGLAGVIAARAKGDAAALAAADQELGQKLVDLHIAEVTRTVARVQESNAAYWNKMRREWQDSVRADPEIGGNRLNTTISEANSFIKRYAGNADQQAEFRQVLQMAGVSEHPAVIRALANAGKTLVKEGAKPTPPGTPPPGPKSRSERRYNGMKMPAG